MKTLIFVLILAGLWLVHYTCPPQADHLRRIYVLANGPDASPEVADQDLPQWAGLEFKDWYFLTATQDKEKKSLISVGITKYVRVMDLDWGLKAFGKAQKND